jgi:hypothetical protein
MAIILQKAKEEKSSGTMQNCGSAFSFILGLSALSRAWQLTRKQLLGALLV